MYNSGCCRTPAPQIPSSGRSSACFYQGGVYRKNFSRHKHSIRERNGGQSIAVCAHYPAQLILLRCTWQVLFFSFLFLSRAIAMGAP